MVKIINSHERAIQRCKKRRILRAVKPKQEKPLNPLSDFWISEQDGHKLSETEARTAKSVAFRKDLYDIMAIDENLNQTRLGSFGATEDKVDRIKGQWHIQNDFQREITHVRDKDMVLIEKLDRVEGTRFEFWSAKSVGYNCFGPFISKDKSIDYVVAKYETDNGPRWGYGKTLEQARAYLGLKLFDEFKDVIHGIACKNQINNK